MSKICVSIHLLSKEMHFFRKGINNFGIKSRNFHVSIYSLTKHTTDNDNVFDILTREKANVLVANLTSEERYNLINALHTHIPQNEKHTYKDQLAHLRWRSKLGKFAKLPNINYVNSNDGCHLPKDLHKTVKNDSRPNVKDLLQVGFISSIAFVAFGFLDNAIMIVAGDYIESFLSNKFPISTMAAAALGNTISDIIGILSSSWVENTTEKLGLKAPNLTDEQLKHWKTRTAVILGRVIGITVGCILGMITIPCVQYFRDR